MAKQTVLKEKLKQRAAEKLALRLDPKESGVTENIGGERPTVCAGCLPGTHSTFTLMTLIDGLTYWVCDDDECRTIAESAESQGTARGVSAYPNKFVVGDLVKAPGWDLIFRVTTVYRDSKRDGGFFKAVLINNSKYHKAGYEIFRHATEFNKVEG